ncbi:MAG: ATP-dependent DNA helicase RecQ [Clostridiaceae bacterium]|nr:ATP-dependent DNA helicase RecQ [Clostridiaceae bacterium]
MDIKRNIKQAMQELGYSKPRKHQVIPIRALADGQDSIIHAPTGSGKTAIFTTAGQVHKYQLTVVVEPLLALIYNQVQALQQQGIAADYLDHTRSKQDTDHILAKACSGKLTFLYVTPERLQNKTFIHAMQETNLYMLVVDECHCITEWGYTFREAYLHIGDFIDKLPHKPVICACSATLQHAQLGQITKALRMKDPVICRCNLERSNLILLKKDVSSKHKSLEKRLAYRVQSLQKCIRKYWTGGAVVVFAMTTNYVDALYNALEEIYPEQVARYHAQVKPEKLKQQMESDFLKGKKKIMIATSAFSMGIDVPDIELLVHFNTPLSMTDYIQQIGRSGRDGRKAHCVLFYDQNGDDKKIVQSMISKAKKQSGKAANILKEHWAQMEVFLESDTCMANDVLRYQGQEAEKTCKRCTNCARNRRGC